MEGSQEHIHDPEKAAEFARALGLSVGGHHPFVGDWLVKGLYAYRSGKYKGQAYFGTGGSESDRLKDTYNSIKPGESHQKYRPWNRDDPKIPEGIRQKLIRLEDRMNLTGKPSTKPLSRDMLRGENILVSEHSIPEYNGIYTIQDNEINGKPWFKNYSGCILYFYNANSGGYPSWSLDDRSQDGTNDWFRGGWIEPPNSGGPPLGTRRWEEAGTIKMESVSIPDESGETFLNSDSSMLQGEISLKGVHGKYLSATPEGRAVWDDDVAHLGEYFRVEQRQNGKIALKGAFDMYVSAQLDGSVEINRREALEWEEFTVEYRLNDLVCLRSCHGKYLSAQPDGTAEWNRDHAPRGGWEEIQIEQLNPDLTHEVDSESTKNAAKIAFGIGIFLIMPGLPLLIIGSTSTSEDRLAMIIPGAILFCLGSFSILVSAIVGLSLRGKSVLTQNTDSTKLVQNPSIEILEAVVGEPVRFRIKGQANVNDAWVGIYPSSLEDKDHGEEGDRWKWLKDIDLDSASFPEQSEGRWSIRVFKDGGYAVVSRVDFDILPKKERWWED